MTLQEARDKVLDIARKEIGYQEGYNNYIKYAEGNWDNQFFGWELQNQPWCDVFVDWCFCQAFGLQLGAQITYQKVGAGSALCSASAQYYKNNGAYYNYPEPGDQVFFNSEGQIGHTGIVERVEGTGSNWTMISTIEGNSSNSVARRNYKRGDPYINGFGRPNWKLVTDPQSQQPVTPTPTQPTQPSQPATIIKNPFANILKKYHTHTYNVKINLLKEGDQGAQVVSMQSLLKAKGFDCEVTGIFDAKTKEALADFQRRVYLTDDGEFGGQSFTKLWDY